MSVYVCILLCILIKNTTHSLRFEILIPLSHLTYRLITTRVLLQRLSLTLHQVVYVVLFVSRVVVEIACGK